MFYIQKNDKLNFLEKIFNIIKIKENNIFLPITEKTTNKQIEKIAQKTENIISKYSNSKKIVLSKEIQKQELYINYLNSYGLDISNGKWLYEILATDIIKYVIDKKNLKKEEIIISVLINDLTDIELENIKILAKNYKSVNIVTNHIEKFKKLEEKLMDEGIIITISNNKKKSLIKSKIVLNVDFPKEMLNKYMINDEAIIINILGKIKINKKRFNGLVINNYDINFREDKKSEIGILNDNFFLRDLYEANIYKKQSFQELRKELKRDSVVVKKVYLNNSEL